MRAAFSGAVFVGLIVYSIPALGQSDPPPFIFEINTLARFTFPAEDADYVFTDGFGWHPSRGESRSELSYSAPHNSANVTAIVSWEPSRVILEALLFYWFDQPGNLMNLATSTSTVKVWARGPGGTSVRVDYAFLNALSVSGCHFYGTQNEDCGGPLNSEIFGTAYVATGVQGRTFPDFPGVFYYLVPAPTCSRIDHLTNLSKFANAGCGFGSNPNYSIANGSRIKSLDYELVDGSPPLPLLNGPFYALVGMSATWVSNSHDPDDGGPPPGNGIIDTAWSRDGTFDSTGPSLTVTFAEADLGQRVVGLEVTDNEGMEAEATRSVRVVRLHDIVVGCLSGPSPPNPPPDPNASCHLYDSDSDGDVDLVDLAAMGVVLSGF